MDKIKLTVSDVDYLLKWRDEHQELIRRSECPKRAVRIEVKESRVTITAIRDGDDITLQVNQNGISLGKIVFKHVGLGICTIVKNKTKLSGENVQACLTVYASCMAFLVYGSETHEFESYEAEESEEQAAAPVVAAKRSGSGKPKKRSDSTVYILHSRSRKQHGNKGKHWTVNHEFSVRGHYRHYKSGKVVWIPEFTKGSGKKKSKTYRVGASIDNDT